MKTFKNFKEVYEAYKRGEVTAIVTRDIAYAQLSIILEEGMTIANLAVDGQHLPETELLRIYEASSEDEEEGFDWQLGGCMHICETEEDLQNIIGLDWEWEEQHDRPPNVTDVATSWDACDYVFGDATTGWGIFLLCTNNAGGHLYYVPEALWEVSRFKEHFALSNPTAS